jgi:hypothetical protein
VSGFAAGDPRPGRLARRLVPLARRLGRYAVALLACLGLVATIVLLTPRRHQGGVPTVNYANDLAALLRAAPYPAYAPVGLPWGWRPTSSRLTGPGTGGGDTGRDEPVAWHLGFVTPSDRYGAVEQSDERPDGPGGFVIRMTSEGRPEGTQPVAGQSWQRYLREDKNQRSLVRRLPGRTLVVTGTADYSELAVLAGSLRPASG